MKKIILSEKAKKLKPGIYEHYKKKRYHVLGIVLHSESKEELVLYKAIYGKGLMWVRPLDMFLEEVEINGVKQPRFKFVQEVE